MPDTDNPVVVATTIATTMPGRNGGTLRRGGTNAGGPGRPPKVVMSRSRALYERILDELEKALDAAGTPLTPEQLVAAGSMAGRYAGLGDDTEKGQPVRVLVVRDVPKVSASALYIEGDRVPEEVPNAYETA